MCTWSCCVVQFVVLVVLYNLLYIQVQIALRILHACVSADTLLISQVNIVYFLLFLYMCCNEFQFF